MEKNYEIKPLVSVCMCTYNHESYIVDAIESILMQQTDFAFELIIGEDCGNDNTREIVRQYAEKYPERIVPVFYSENHGSTKNLIHLIQTSQAEIIAICDGDDYWIDPFKMKKEFDIFNNNPEYGMLCSKSSRYVQLENQFEGFIGDVSSESYEEVFKGFNDVSAPSLVFRKHLLLDCIKDCEPLILANLFFDTPIVLWFSYYKKVKFFDEVRSVYRVLPNSASHLVDETRKLKFNQMYVYIKLFFAIHFPVTDFNKADKILHAINQQIEELIGFADFKGSKQARQSFAYVVGNKIVNPFRILKEIIKSKKLRG